MTWVVVAEALVVVTRAAGLVATTAAGISCTVRAWVVVVRGAVLTACVRAATVYTQTHGWISLNADKHISIILLLYFYHTCSNI